MYCWTQFASIFVDNLDIYNAQESWPIILIFCNVFVFCFFGFGMKVMLASQNKSRSALFSSVFWNRLRWIGIDPCSSVWLNSPLRPSGPGLLFVRGIFITVSSSLLVIDLFRFYVSSWLSLRRLYDYSNIIFPSPICCYEIYMCIHYNIWYTYTITVKCNEHRSY